MITFKLKAQHFLQTITGRVSAQEQFANLGKVIEKLTTYVQKSCNCLVQEPQLFMMRKLARFEIVREGYRWFNSVCPADKSTSTSLLAVDVQTVVAQINQDGCFPGLQLPPAIVQELLAFAATAPCCANRNPNLPFQIADQPTLQARLASSNQPLVLASYMGSHESCPAFQQLVNDPGLLAIAEQYFGKSPRYVSSELMWSFPTSTTLFQQLQAAQVLHCDIDDYSCIKFFFYLTDVDELSGPHIYLRASHKNKPLLHQILGKRCASIPDHVLIEHYGPDNLIALCGAAGYGFVEDIFGFHKGSPPQSRNRLLLQIEFAPNTYKTLRSCEW
jgi:hypothetical protein